MLSEKVTASKSGQMLVKRMKYNNNSLSCVRVTQVTVFASNIKHLTYTHRKGI